MFPLSIIKGELEYKSLFEEIEVPMTTGGRIDSERIPEGAVVVMTSSNIHGHAEIKTNRRDCGKNKDEICFCSDFCSSREGEKSYEKSGFTVKKMFVPNKKLLEHMNETLKNEDLISLFN